MTWGGVYRSTGNTVPIESAEAYLPSQQALDYSVPAHPERRISHGLAAY